jgi:hypothetical protein
MVSSASCASLGETVAARVGGGGGNGAMTGCLEGDRGSDDVDDSLAGGGGGGNEANVGAAIAKADPTSIELSGG